MKLRALYRRKIVLAGVAGALGSVHTANAAPIYWIGNGPTDWAGATSWSANADGTGSNALPQVGDVATFSSSLGTGDQTVDLNDDRSVAGLSFTQTGVTTTLRGGGTNRTLSLGASGIAAGVNTKIINIGSATAGQNVAVSLLAAQSWTFAGPSVIGNGIFVPNSVSLGIAGNHTLSIGGAADSSAQSIISGVISDGGADRVLSITMNPSVGGNRWTLSGNNTYAGVTTISAGAMTLGHVNALGATTANTTVASGAGLFFRATIGTFAAEPLSIAGAGPSNLGSLRNVAGDNTWTGPITATVSSNVVIGADAGTLVLSSTADIATTGSSTIQFTTNGAGGAGAITVNGNISGTVAVAKTTGTNNVLTFGGDTKTYSGATTISAGLFSLNTTLQGTSAVSVALAGTLRGINGSINTAATTTVNGTVGPGVFGTPISTLSMGPLTITSTGTVAVDINTTTLASDRLTVTGALTLDLGNASTLTVTDAGANAVLAEGTTFTLIDYSGVWNGGLFKVGSSVIADDTGMFTVGANTYAINYNGGPSNNDVILQVVPEPAGLSMAAMVVGGLLARRRRSRM